VVSTVERIRFTLMAWLNGILLKQCLGWQLLGERVPLVFTYHPSLEKISGIVRHYWKEIQKSETTPFLSSCYGTLVRVANGDSTCNACHHMVYPGQPSMKV
jgi:hypothetical protein